MARTVMEQDRRIQQPQNPLDPRLPHTRRMGGAPKTATGPSGTSQVSGQRGKPRRLIGGVRVAAMLKKSALSMVIGVLALAAGAAVPARASAQPAPGDAAVEDVVLRDRLIADQENLLNAYRCRFGADTQAVPGGCSDPHTVVPGAAPQNPTPGDLAIRDALIRSQEELLNAYRCQHNIDTQLVPTGCPRQTPVASDQPSVEDESLIDIYYDDYGNLWEKQYYNRDDQFHREDGPAKIFYYENGEFLRKEYYQNDELHREDGPAVIYYYENGQIEEEVYYQNGEIHREDGPAVIGYDEEGDVASREYWQNDQLISSD